MMSQFPYKEAYKIHVLNGYDKDPRANEAFNRVANEVGGAAWADVFKAASFDDYAEAVEAIDDEPFAVY